MTDIIGGIGGIVGIVATLWLAWMFFLEDLFDSIMEKRIEYKRRVAEIEKENKHESK